MKDNIDKLDIDACLEENGRRLALLSKAYNPVTGKNTPGMRFECVLTDLLNGQTLYLPVQMLTEKWFQLLVSCGSVHAFAEQYMEDDSAAAVEAGVRAFCRLRCKHDFYFFAYTYARIKN